MGLGKGFLSQGSRFRASVCTPRFRVKSLLLFSLVLSSKEWGNGSLLLLLYG